MDQEKIGQFIKKIRKDNNLTQKDLADKLGVTYQAVSKWENGKNVPDISTLQQISKEFNLNIDEILEGRKNTHNTNKNKLSSLIIILLVIILLITVGLLLVNKKDRDFEFKTISSKCEDFKITGSAAYNRDKATIYISNIEFCKKDDNEEYKSISCTLYETYNNTKVKLSSCDKKNNINLENYLKEVNINVDNFSSQCRKLTSSVLTLEINAINKENKNIIYTIPIKLNDSCKK